jgi:hypothetical protein
VSHSQIAGGGIEPDDEYALRLHVCGGWLHCTYFCLCRHVYNVPQYHRSTQQSLAFLLASHVYLVSASVGKCTDLASVAPIEEKPRLVTFSSCQPLYYPECLKTRFAQSSAVNQNKLRSFFPRKPPSIKRCVVPLQLALLLKVEYDRGLGVCSSICGEATP